MDGVFSTNHKELDLIPVSRDESLALQTTNRQIREIIFLTDRQRKMIKKECKCKLRCAIKFFCIIFSYIRYHGSSSSIKCNVYHHVGGGDDTYPWSATNVRNPILATIPVTKKNNQQTTETSHYVVDR